MVIDAKTELPHGFTMKLCPSIRAQFPMPLDWFYREEENSIMRSCYLTRDLIRPSVLFTTGLTVFAEKNIKKKHGYTPLVRARSYMDTQTEMQPIGDWKMNSKGRLVTFRGFFQTDSRTVNRQLIQPATYYVEATANDRTDTVYYITFETPTSKWEQDAEIAHTMIDNRILDEKY